MITKSKIQLWVDGQPCNIHSVWIHFQRDPYPGGHKFRILLSRDLMADWVDEKRDELDEQAIRGALWELEGAISSSQKDESNGGPTEYVLNTLSVVREVDREIELVGECSRFVSAQTKKP